MRGDPSGLQGAQSPGRSPKPPLKGPPLYPVGHPHHIGVGVNGGRGWAPGGSHRDTRCWLGAQQGRVPCLVREVPPCPPPFKPGLFSCKIRGPSSSE